MLRERTLAFLIALAICTFSHAAEKKAKPFSWPQKPTPEVVQTALKMKSDSGLVILERKCTVHLRSCFAEPYLIQKEEFLRFLVLNEVGVTHSKINLAVDEGASIILVEGRTVSPLGEITPLDRDRDVTIARVRGKREWFNWDIGGTARFPAPSVGALLDLHFICEATPAYPPYYYGQTLLYDLTSTLKADFEVHIEGGAPAATSRWSMLSFGMGQGGCKLQALPNRQGFSASMGTFVLDGWEPDSPPAYHLSPYVLCFVDFSDPEITGNGVHGSERVMTWDSRGQIQGIEFPAGDPSTKWWQNYFEEFHKYVREFLKWDGRASEIRVSDIAPETLSLEERARRLYSCAQSTVRWNPDAERNATLKEAIRQGANDNWQATLCYSYLLKKANIPHAVGFVANRYAMRYSPVAMNGGLYDFQVAVILELEKDHPLLLQPGEISLEFGCSPFERQEALVFLSHPEGTLRAFYSPPNPPDKDLLLWKYALEMDNSGGASGSVTLEEHGAVAHGFKRWYLLRELHHKNPKVAKQEKSSEQDMRQELADEVEAAFTLPGGHFTASGRELVRCGPAVDSPLVMQGSIVGKNIGTSSGGRWLVAANPLMLGFGGRYNQKSRMNPIWNRSAGKRVAEGELLLPPGATVVELPSPQEVKGPNGIIARYQVERVERGGRILLKSRMEYELPLIVGRDQYASYRNYLDAVARLGEDRCIVGIPQEKVLE